MNTGNVMDLDREILERLKESKSLENEKACFGNCLDSIGWWIVEKIPANLHELKQLIAKNSNGFGAYFTKNRVSLEPIRQALLESSTTKRVEKFSCSDDLHGFVYPLTIRDKISGFIGTLYTRKDIDTSIINIFSSFTDTVVMEVEKEYELAKLHETVRPRAIALSTVHTVHRLISSTLDLNELLPRIARLSLQIIRANRCSIKLVDSTRKVLLPKTTVDLREKKTRLKKVRIGRWAPGKSVKLSKPVRGERYLAVPLIDEDVIGVITIYDKIDRKPFTAYDEEIMTTLAEQAVIAIKNAQLYKEQEKLTLGGIKSLAAVLDAHRPIRHTPKLSLHKITLLIGQKLSMDEHELRCLEYAAVLHDAGQLVVPEEVLRKPTKLTGQEYELVKEHPERSVKIIKPIRTLKAVIPIILHHHENYNGSGYPKGLKGEQIPLGARIMAVVDAFEAMITKRPYRKPMDIDDAIEEIRKNSGTQFDPKVVTVFLQIIKKHDIRSMLEKEIDDAR